MSKYDWFRKKEDEETVGSYAKRLEFEKNIAQNLPEAYKPTKEEQKVIKLLKAPILAKIEELQSEYKKMRHSGERDMIERAIGNMLDKLIKISVPQKMLSRDIEELIYIADVRKKYIEEIIPKDWRAKVDFLNLEIDYLLDQFIKRLKK